jgi:hypothetical protein
MSAVGVSCTVLPWHPWLLLVVVLLLPACLPGACLLPACCCCCCAVCCSSAMMVMLLCCASCCWWLVALGAACCPHTLQYNELSLNIQIYCCSGSAAAVHDAAVKGRHRGGGSRGSAAAPRRGARRAYRDRSVFWGGNQQLCVAP